MRHLKFYKRAAIIAELHSLGRTNRQCRELLGLNGNQISGICKFLGIKLAYDRTGWNGAISAAQSKAAKMAAMYRAGMTLQQIGEKYGVSRERVRQLMTKYLGTDRRDGGQHLKADAKRRGRIAERDTRYVEKYGCTFAQWMEVRAIGAAMIAGGSTIYQTPLRAFIQQKNNAKARGISWELKFWQWWTVWQESQKWELRGRAKNAFVMCRFNDDGPYAVGNVFIGTLAENSSVQPNNPYRVGHPDHIKAVEVVRVKLRKNAVARAESGKNRRYNLPLGVTMERKTQRYIAQISINGRRTYLGTYSSPDLAHAAYLRALSSLEESAA